MLSLIDALKTTAKHLVASQNSLKTLLENSSTVLGRSRRSRSRTPQSPMCLEALEQRMLLSATNAISSGDWSDADTWDNGVPDEDTRAIINHGVTVELDGTDHFAMEVVVHGNLVVSEETQASDPTVVEDGRMKLYVNGGLVGDAPASQLWDHSDMAGIGGVTGQTRTHLGMQRTGNRSGNFFDGTIDQVATYNKALNSGEIESLSAGTRATHDGIPQEELASLWMFDQSGTQWTPDTAPFDQKSDNGLLRGDATAEGELSLDGDGDYVKVGRSVDINRGVFTEKTVSLWFKADNTDGLQTLYEQGGGTRGLHVYLQGDTLYAGGWNFPNRESGWKGDWITQPGIVAGEWNHVVLTLDADGGEGAVDKSLTADWVHVNGGGQFIVGSGQDRYDEGTFTLNLIGTDLTADPVIPMRMESGMVIERTLTNNNGFLMAGMNGRIQFVGEDKLSFTKLAGTAGPNETSITVANFIERNFNANGEVVTSADDDGQLNWEVGDQIVIASSSYDYTEEEVRTITSIVNNGDTSTLSFVEPLEFRHYGEIETYGSGADTRTIDMRSEVALLSRNIKVQGLAAQDTDVNFGDRGNLQTTIRVDANGLSEAEKTRLPELQVANGVGGHIMIMGNAGDIVVDGVQLAGMGQSSQKGRYPIHWHLGGDRSNDVFRNSSVTNSNNRGVTIHGTNNLTIEGVVVHDVHGHGFFFEDAVETGNKLVGNLVLGVHAVGGKDFGFYQPGTNDPFVVDTHDSIAENRSRFSNSAAYWITNPRNTFIGNIAAGAGDQRNQRDAAESGVNPDKAPEAGTGFWYAIPRTAIGESSKVGGGFEDYHPIFEEFGQFDYNTSHTTAVGLNFDRGSDIEDANFKTGVDFNAIQGTNEYAPRLDPDNAETGTVNFVNDFTNYKASEAAVYHRGKSNSIQYQGLRIADSYNGPWAVSETQFHDSLYVGHSQENSPDKSIEVGGPRLYDGAGRHAGAHFAGFAEDAASTFQVEGSSFGPTMYHVFPGVSFENDNTYNHMAHAISDFSSTDPGRGHNLGAPQQWIKAAIDVDGSLTGPANGGVGYSIVPKVDFLVDEDDKARTPNGWDAYLTDDLYARIRVENKDDGSDVGLFPGESENPFIVFTADDGDQLLVDSGQNQGNGSWTQVAAKADAEGRVDSTFTIGFGTDGVPEGGFVLNMKNQDGGWLAEYPELQERVDNARIVLKIASASNYTPSVVNNGAKVALKEVASLNQLREERSENAFYRADGNLYLNTGINDSQKKIHVDPTGEELQSAVESRTIDFGTVIQAEAFDNGGEGVAYHDTDGAVDVSPTSVVNITDGEWLEYSAAIESGLYRIGLNVAAAEAGGKISLLAAKDNSAGYLQEIGSIDVPATTNGESETVWLNDEELIDLAFVEGPDSVIRLAFEGGGFEVDSLQFASAKQSAFEGRSVESLTVAADAVTRIELEHYDTGGQGVAYFDKQDNVDGVDEKVDVNTQSTTFRPGETVDATDTQLNATVFEGEWLEYTTSVEAGTFDLTLFRKWGSENAGVRVMIGDSNSTSEFTVLGDVKGAGVAHESGEGQLVTLSNIEISEELAGADRVIRLEILDNWMGLDWLEFNPLE